MIALCFSFEEEAEGVFYDSDEENGCYVCMNRNLTTAGRQ